MKERNRIFSPEEEEKFAELNNENSVYKILETKHKMKIILSPFIIILGIIDLLLFVMSISYLLIDDSGGKALGGLIALIGFIIFLIVLAIEQYILSTQRFKKENVWIVETIILFGIVLFVAINGISIG